MADKYSKFAALPIVPRHIAIIMDGNGRWAKKRLMPRSYGHLKGSDNVQNALEFCEHMKVECLTLYAFSTENWKRSDEEVTKLFELALKFFKEYNVKYSNRNNKIVVSGILHELPKELYDAALSIMNVTKDKTGTMLNICFNYGSQREIIEAVKSITKDVMSNKKTIDSITNESLELHLTTANMPPVDLLIRTGGEVRLSNFLLWQLAYAELYFCDTLWPDFKDKELYKAIEDFSKRKRNYGGVK